MPLTIGLSGGIASGKSAVGQYFSDLGVPVIDADQISRQVVQPGTAGLQALVNHFGAEILDPSGQMDRQRMRERVFSQPESRKDLEDILHPLIREELGRQKTRALQQSPFGYCILMIPLLIKFGWLDIVDRVLIVDCEESVQLNRLVARDDITETLARNMLNAQETRQERLAAADDVITNDDSLETLHNAVTALHNQYLQLSQG